MIKSHIHIIKMGGTIEFIDPAYGSINKKIMKLDSTIESYLINIIKPHFSFSTESLAEKDSRELTQQDREKLAHAITTTPHTKIVITHGTFTMNETAQFLEKQTFKDKKIILTGSMIPVIGFSVSDAGFNLGFTIASFNSIKPGIYISMNGGIFTPGDVEKNIDLLRFE